MKKALVILLTITLCLNASFAITFNDLDKATWAEDYIMKLAEMGIVTGYTDGSYKPLDSVSHYAAVLVIYRTLDAQGLIDADQADVYVNRYRSTLTEYDVPDWPMLHRAIAFCLENDIIAKSDIAGFIKDGQHQSISRENMAKYLGKALNLFLKENVDKVFTLPYKDVAKINTSALKYVNLLSEHKIISGDNNGYFNPQNSLNRAALAKMIITSIDALENTQTVTTAQIEATVYIKLDDYQKVVFYKKGSTTESYTEKLDSSVEILLGDVKGSYSDLEEDMPVVLTYANNKLVKVQASAKPVVYDEVTGQVTEPIIFNNRRVLYVLNDKTKETEFYELTEDAMIYKVDVSSDFSDIQVGDRVILKVDGNSVYEVQYQTKNQTLKGTFVSYDESTNSIVVKVGTGELTLMLDGAVAVMRNDAVSTVVDLFSGDEVTIETTYDMVVKVNATGADTVSRGTIEKLNIGDTNELTLQAVGGESSKYQVAQGATISIDGQSKSFYELRIGYRVTARVEEGVIMSIVALSKVEKTHLIGTIEKIYSDTGVVIISTGSSYTLNTTTDTLFIDANGNKSSINTLVVGQKVFAYGELSANLMAAEKLLILEEVK